MLYRLCHPPSPHISATILDSFRFVEDSIWCVITRLNRVLTMIYRRFNVERHLMPDFELPSWHNLCLLLLIRSQYASAFTPRLLEYVLTEFCPRRQSTIHIIVRQTAPVFEHFAICASRFEIYLSALALVEHPPHRTAGRTFRISLMEQIYVAYCESVVCNIIR